MERQDVLFKKLNEIEKGLKNDPEIKRMIEKFDRDLGTLSEKDLRIRCTL